MTNDIENAKIILSDLVRYDRETEMTACPGCGRLSPPDRSTCLYCGKELPVTEISKNVAPKHLRRPENWENVFNVIFTSVSEDINKVNPEVLADALGLDAQTVTKIIELGGSLPLFRAGSEADAVRLLNYLRSNGLECAIVPRSSFSRHSAATGPACRFFGRQD